MEDVYRLRDLVAHYAESRTRRLGHGQTLVATPDELETGLRAMVAELRAQQAATPASFWSEYDAAGEGSIGRLFVQAFRCWDLPDGPIVFLDQPPGLAEAEYRAGECTEGARARLVDGYLELAVPESDLES